MRSLYVNQLAFDWVEDSTTEIIRIGVNKKIDSFGEGDLEYATEILSALWEIVNQDGDIGAPSDGDSEYSVAGDVDVPSSIPPTVSRFWFGFFLASYGRAYFAESVWTGHQPRPLGFCEDRAHQVDS